MRTQTHLTLACAPALALLLAAPALAGNPSVEKHEIDVTLSPAASKLTATDRLTVVRDGGGPIEFTLNSGLTLDAVNLDGRETKAFERVEQGPWISRWRLDVPPAPGDKAVIELSYSGAVGGSLEKSKDLSFTVGDDSHGVLDDNGAYLSGGTGWYADDGAMALFHVTARVPKGYLTVTQGTLTSRTADKGDGSDLTRWTGKLPSDGLSLVAGKLHYSGRQVGKIKIGTYLSEANAGGSELLLDAAAKYLTQYGELLGPYAYDRFDIVENWFTTGYGMPEFTLLGPMVIQRMVAESQRMGSIPAGYLDHEIVHCWWGNLVYPDYEHGNWCEALTSYCSNYMSKEWESAESAAQHRKRTALRFALKSTPQNDYPLRAFVTKHEDVDNEIGYGKGSMVFHMLRREIGDDAFFGTLRKVAHDFAGKRLGWDGWQTAFEAAAKRNLTGFFTQWLDRKGAPLLQLVDAKLSTEGGRMRVSGTVRQVLAPGEQPWTLTVPVVIEHLEGFERLDVSLAAQDSSFSLAVPSLPLSVSVDPDHEVFRTFAPREIPACLAATLARPDVLVVYPDGDAALEQLAARVAEREGVEALPASKAPSTPPSKRSLIVFGDAARVPLLATLRASLPSAFPGARASAETTVLASSRSPVDPAEFVTTFVGAPEALAGRARAVFYYQYDGRILFEGRVPRERTDAEARSSTRALVLPDLSAMTVASTVKDVIDKLTGDGMDGRRAGSDGDRATRVFLREQLTLLGLDVTEEPVSFVVRHVSRSTVALLSDGKPVADVLPLTASPLTVEGGVSAPRVATDPDGVLTGSALLLDLPEGSEDPLAFVRATASLAKKQGAVALLLRRPATVSDAVAELWETPETLSEAVALRMMEGAAKGRDADPALRAAGTAARTGALTLLDLPTLVVPRSYKSPELGVRVTVAFREETIDTVNIIGRLSSSSPDKRGALLLSAHFDHLGEGFAGADDNASGVAALLQTAAILSTRREELSRDVRFAFFGAEEWGLRGSRAYVAARRDKPGGLPAYAVNADTVGRAGKDDVHVLGATLHPRLGRIVSAALEQAGLGIGRDIDRFAYAHGSDHWTLHEAGVPSIGLWSGDYQVMHTKADTADGIDAGKIEKIARALAMTALAVNAAP